MEKNNKLRMVLTIVLLGVFLAAFSLWAVLKPADAFSEAERRTLAQMPAATGQTLLSGTFADRFEDYATDQFPLRGEFRTLKAFTATGLLHQRDNNGLYRVGDHLAKLEYPMNESSLENAATRFGYLYETYLKEAGARVYFSLIPDKNFFMAAPNGYPSMDYTAFADDLQQKLPYMKYIDLFDLLELEDYYRTDAHWRQEKLLPVAARLANGMGLTLTGSYTQKTLEKPFYGVYYGQAALPIAPEPMNYLTGGAIDAATVYNYETNTTGSVYDMEKAVGHDPYEMFLSGSVSLLRIENPQNTSGRRLVLFRDSFGSSLTPLLIEGYSSITLVDIRYLASNRLGKYVDFTDCDVLFLYSTGVLNNSSTLK